MSSFDSRAATWDSPERADRAIAVASAIRAAVPVNRATRALEFGAGTGLLGMALAPHVGSLVLADASTGMLEVAAGKLADAGLDHVEVLRHRLLVDPLPAERFDLVCSLTALHHVLDTDSALSALRAILAPGGHLAVADLDTEDGTFHSDPAAPVLHGYDRADLGSRAVAAGFEPPVFSTVWEIAKNGRTYPLFLMVARRP